MLFIIFVLFSIILFFTSMVINKWNILLLIDKIEVPEAFLENKKPYVAFNYLLLILLILFVVIFYNNHIILKISVPLVLFLLSMYIGAFFAFKRHKQSLKEMIKYSTENEDNSDVLEYIKNNNIDLLYKTTTFDKFRVWCRSYENNKKINIKILYYVVKIFLTCIK